MRRFLLCLSIIGLLCDNKAQYTADKFVFKDLVIKVDTLQFRYSKEFINFKNERQLYFSYDNPDEEVELNIFPYFEQSITSVELFKSSDFVQLDTILLIDNEYFRTKVKFINLNKSQFLSFIFKVSIKDVEEPIIHEIKLFPFTKTTVNFFPNSDELYIGEEKVFELETNNQSNIRISNEWTTGLNINYLISEKNGQIRIHLLPSVLGNQQVPIRLYTNRPFLNEKKEIKYDLPEIVRSFKIKSSRLAFLYIDRKEISFDDESRRNGVELQVDNNRQLQAGKTYRIEDQEQSGGPLIAELFVKRFLANDRAWCLIRPYNLHRQTEGYLYIKDGDDPKFITNLSITPKTSISSIQVMHEGQDWTSNLSVYPDENIDVKIEGEGLHKAKFHWEDVIDNTSDTLTRNENTCYFKLHIPMNINRNKIELYNYANKTGNSLSVKEYQLPHLLDFVNINDGNGFRPLTIISPSIIKRNTISDIIIGFNNKMIDTDKKLFGKQYLDIDIKLIGQHGELIEMKQLKNLVVCPDEHSPRAPYYKDKACTNSEISLNSLLSNKTYNLNDFSRVQLEIRQIPDKYTDQTYSKQMEFVLQRKVVFDFDLSFPAGLLIQNIGQTQSEKDNMSNYNTNFSAYNIEHNAYLKELEQWTANPQGSKPVYSGPSEPVKPKKTAFTDNLGGISMAIIMQFSFPDAQKVGYIKPYRLGVGFLAINAFNFSNSAQRDLAVVMLASFYPLKHERLFSLPIHFGFAYKFQDKIPFVMLSPGIGVRF